MSKRLGYVTVTLAFGMVLVLGCDEPVGAPCTPETDKGKAISGTSGQTDAIETRSVQCETRTCITRTEANSKYSFCSCKCGNLEGYGPSNGGTKSEDLCDCPDADTNPPKTKCASLKFPIGTDPLNPVTPPKVLGKYCVPTCILDGCPSDDPLAVRKCSPSDDSKEPWNWKCKSVN